ncbi:MAG: hypothetical protein GY820_01205 [Gammaproteobacteria bacterium]|nr:hypothetical protein [Gammaproteobacteria bacterium]
MHLCSRGRIERAFTRQLEFRGNAMARKLCAINVCFSIFHHPAIMKTNPSDAELHADSESGLTVAKKTTYGGITKNKVTLYSRNRQFWKTKSPILTPDSDSALRFGQRNQILRKSSKKGGKMPPEGWLF